MPRIKQPEPWGKMTRLLRGYGLSGPELAKILGCSAPTARKRLENPGTLSLEEIYAISCRAHVPMEELRAAIQR